MKYPKLRDGPSPVGESHIRALHQVDDRLAPFLTKEGPDGTFGYKKNGFDEVHQAQGAPYLWGRYLVNTPTLGGVVYVAVLSPEDHLGFTQFYKGVYSTTGSANVAAFPFAVFVGDNYVLEMQADDVNTALDTTNFWPSIVRADGLGREYLENEAGHERHTITYIDTAKFGGLALSGHWPALWATGWDNDTTRYRFGMTLIAAGANPAPACYVGSTGQYQLTQVAYPYFPGRNHHQFTAYCAGPGKLHALHFVDNTTDSPAHIDPYLAYSNNHGSSWATAAVGGIVAVMPPAPTTEAHQVTMGLYTTIVHVGDGLTLMVVPNGFVDGDYLTGRYAPMLFVGNGTTYSRLSWPCDTWYVDRNGLPTAGNANQVGFTYMRQLRGAHWSFGRGCMYLPVFKDGAWRIMFTTDFGGTWAFSAPVPSDLVAPSVTDFAGAIVKPRVDAQHLGRIIFAGPDYTANKLNFYATDGSFSEFKNLGAVVKPRGDLYATGSDSLNYYYVNYGGKRYPPWVYPAFPKLFDRP